MDELLLFTDGSVNTRSNIGYGAYLAVADSELSLEALRAQVQVRRFEPTSSTKLELQTLLWALGAIDALGSKLTVYTDSQNIMGLPARRQRFERNDYRSKKNERLANYTLYQQFYRMTDQLDCTFVKVPGHQASRRRDAAGRLFSLVDRASRSMLRENSREPGGF